MNQNIDLAWWANISAIAGFVVTFIALSTKTKTEEQTRSISSTKSETRSWLQAKTLTRANHNQRWVYDTPPL